MLCRIACLWGWLTCGARLVIPDRPSRRVCRPREGYGITDLSASIGRSVLLGLFGGRWLDGKLGTDPWLTWIGLGLGIVTGYRAIWLALKRANREAKKAEEQARSVRKHFTDDHQDREN